MCMIIRVIIQNSLYQNKNREEVKNREIRYLPDLIAYTQSYFKPTEHLKMHLFLPQFSAETSHKNSMKTK